MPGQDWSIKIVPSGALAGFEPDVPGSHVGDPLQAQNADLISWNNATEKPHWPWAIDPATKEPYATAADAKAASMYLCDEVEPWQSSSPTFVTTAPKAGSTTIDYICHLHDGESGQIIIWATI
jgi:hypothetical protein